MRDFTVKGAVCQPFQFTEKTGNSSGGSGSEASRTRTLLSSSGNSSASQFICVSCHHSSVAAHILCNPALSRGDASDPEIDVILNLKADSPPPAIALFGSKDKWLEGWNPACEKLKSIGNDKVDFQMAEGEGHAFFNYQPWADITLTAADRFLQKLGYLEGEPTLPASPNGEGAIVQL